MAWDGTGTRTALRGHWTLSPLNGGHATQAEYQVHADPAQIDRILAAGAEKARILAAPVIEETKRRVGFWSATA